MRPRLVVIRSTATHRLDVRGSPSVCGETAARAIGSPPAPIYTFAATPLKVAAGQHPLSTAKLRTDRSVAARWAGGMFGLTATLSPVTRDRSKPAPDANRSMEDRFKTRYAGDAERGAPPGAQASPVIMLLAEHPVGLFGGRTRA
jgi:hypothetical protein